MRRALATTTLAGALALGGPLLATEALAASPPADIVRADSHNTDADEPGSNDGEDDTGKYGLAGLAGLLGLFGYRKYKDHRATVHRTGGTDTGGSRRV